MCGKRRLRFALHHGPPSKGCRHGLSLTPTSCPRSTRSRLVPAAYPGPHELVPPDGQPTRVCCRAHPHSITQPHAHGCDGLGVLFRYSCVQPSPLAMYRTCLNGTRTWPGAVTQRWSPTGEGGVLKRNVDKNCSMNDITENEDVWGNDSCPRSSWLGPLHRVRAPLARCGVPAKRQAQKPDHETYASK